MTGYRLTFSGTEFVALGSGALFCPSNSALILADLHLGKSERMARRGGALLPPFETRDTLSRLQSVLQTTKAEKLFLLGDVFDDEDARNALTVEDNLTWQSIRATTNCAVIAGNHDPLGRTEVLLGNITPRHSAGTGPDISGHFHPKARLKNVTRPAFLVGKYHLILPAFGTFTGGLSATDPVLSGLVGQGVIVLIGTRPIAFPYELGRFV